MMPRAPLSDQALKKVLPVDAQQKPVCAVAGT
jgi:hypothetical protein